MQVSFRSLPQYSSTFSDFTQPFIQTHAVDNKPTRDEIVIAKTKKALSECKIVAIGIGILYFAMKKNLKVNKIRNHERKLEELAKMKIPKPQLINVAANELLRF